MHPERMGLLLMIKPGIGNLELGISKQNNLWRIRYFE